MHCTDSSASGIRQCVDQAPAVGFEMVIISFGAGFNLESTDPVYLAGMRNISDYAAAKGIEMGGYDLLAHTRGRGGNASAECIGPNGKPDGSTCCLASQGSDDVFMHINNFVDKTNWSSVECGDRRPIRRYLYNTQCLTAGPTHVRVASCAAALPPVLLLLNYRCCLTIEL
jgi:hypothetical protein